MTPEGRSLPRSSWPGSATPIRGTYPDASLTIPAANLFESGFVFKEAGFHAPKPCHMGLGVFLSEEPLMGAEFDTEALSVFAIHEIARIAAEHATDGSGTHKPKGVTATKRASRA